MVRRARRPSYNNALLSLSVDAWSLYLDASTVIGLRMMKFAAGGPETGQEMALMINEKLQSAIELQVEGATGQLGASPAGTTRKVIRHYKRKVDGNKKRLLKS